MKSPLSRCNSTKNFYKSSFNPSLDFSEGFSYDCVDEKVGELGHLHHDFIHEGFMVQIELLIRSSMPLPCRRD